MRPSERRKLRLPVATAWWNHNIGSDTTTAAARRDLSPAAQRRLALGVAALVIVAYALLVSEGDRGHFDHYLFRDTVEYMHDGEGYYDAMERALADRDVISARETAYRYPTVFLLWRLIPVDLLWPAFLVLVVGLTAAIVVRLTDRPLIVVLVVVYLLTAGRVPGTDTSRESWLLVELWTVPALAGALLAHRRGHPWAAAGLALLAAVTREITVLLLVGGLLHAVVRKERWQPWATALGAFAAVTAAHFAVASQHVAEVGNDAELIGSGNPPTSITNMMTWLVPGPDAIGIALWVLAVVYVTRAKLLPLTGPLLAIPLAGLVVARPYWGLVVIPFTILWGLEAFTDAVARLSARVRRAGRAGEGSSPPRRTPTPGPRSREGEQAPPSG